MDILELLTSQLSGSGALGKLGESVGADSEKVKKAAQLGLPAILQALNRNASTSEGAASLAKALDSHKDDEVDDLMGFFSRVDREDGDKILNHVFSDRKARVQNNLAKQTGMDSGQVAGLLTQLAPLVLGVLGQQKKQQNLDSSGVSGLTSSVLGSLGGLGGGGLLGIAKGLLDSDGDGDIIDNIKSLLGSGALGKVGQSVGANQEQTRQATQVGLTAMLQALSRNAGTKEGAQSLAKALDSHKDDDVSDIAGFFDRVDKEDGAKILNHVFAGRNEKVQKNLAKQTGMDASQVAGLMTQLAPLVLGMLGQQKKRQNLDSEGVAGLTSTLAGSVNQLGDGNIMDMAAGLLDSDGDGNVLGGLKGLLGSIFKK